MNMMGRRAGLDSVLRDDVPNIRNEIQQDVGQRAAFAVIDSRKLERECFVRVIKANHEKISITAFGSDREWSDASHGDQPCVILLNIGGRKASVRAVAADLEGLVAEAGGTPVIVLSESEELRDMIAAVDCGAQGYIPASVGVDVIIEAARLTSAGGIFLPSSSLLALREAVTKEADRPTGIEEHFTSRQAAVADALRRGKANKTIAYELNMCESTVKVHIRTIMKKLRASNRTQAAFKLNSLFPRDQTDPNLT
jgi:DNA-binding NarL/FixJ family response regulator